MTMYALTFLELVDKHAHGIAELLTLALLSLLFIVCFRS